MLLKLLRKLTVDVSRLSEYSTVALRVIKTNSLHLGILVIHLFFFLNIC